MAPFVDKLAFAQKSNELVGQNSQKKTVMDQVASVAAVMHSGMTAVEACIALG